MGVIIKRNTVYGGGGGTDNSVDITLAEYEKLEADGLTLPNTTYYITDINDSDITDDEEVNGVVAITLTQAEYDALSEEEKANGIYVVSDGEDLTAKNLAYDGSVTGLGNNVQDAVDAVNDKVDEQNKNFDNTIDMGMYDFSPSRIAKFLSVISGGKLLDTLSVINVINNSPVLSMGGGTIGNVVISLGDIRMSITKIYIGYNPNSNNRALVIEWFADGTDYKSYIDITAETEL